MRGPLSYLTRSGALLCVAGVIPAGGGKCLARAGETGKSRRVRRQVATALANHLTHLVQINPRTLSRRRREGRLHADESDRVLRLSRVYGRTLDLFGGDLDKARHWLSTPKVALGDESPLDYSRVDVGAQEVVDLIERIEHGIPS